LEPELTDLIFVVVQRPGYSILLLQMDLPQDFGAPAGCCFAVLPRSAAAKETPGVVRLEENILPVIVLGVLCDFDFCSSSFACLQPR
jgi:hypothetical protein